MSRVQLALNVADLEGSVAFHSKLFGVEPAEHRPGYANFAITEPPLKLVLIEGEPGRDTRLDHLGVEVETTDQVTAATERLKESGLATFRRVTHEPTAGSILRRRGPASSSRPPRSTPASPSWISPGEWGMRTRSSLSAGMSVAASVRGIAAGPPRTFCRRGSSPPRKRCGIGKRCDLNVPCGSGRSASSQVRGYALGRSVHQIVISPVSAPSSRAMETRTGNSGRCPASSSATTSAAGRPSSAVAVTGPMASFL